MRAEKVGYGQPCRTLLAGTTVDLHVVSDALLSTSGIPASLPITQPTLSGRIVEQTPQGLQPVAGARVTGDFSGGLGWGAECVHDQRYTMAAICCVAWMRGHWDWPCISRRPGTDPPMFLLISAPAGSLMSSCRANNSDGRSKTRRRFLVVAFNSKDT